MGLSERPEPVERPQVRAAISDLNGAISKLCAAGKYGWADRVAQIRNVIEDAIR